MEIFEEDIFQDDLDVLDIIDAGFPRRIRIRSNIFENLDEYTFYKRFRLTKETTLNLHELIEGELEYTTTINNSVSSMNRLLLFLRFVATGGHLSTLADFGNMDISTVSRIIYHVVRVIAALRPRFIQMPINEEIQKTYNKFFEIAHFPRILGCVDGSHIRIQSPGGEEGEIFRNRKGYFSINIQAICDAQLKILDLVARWPGSQHDATIYNSSRICTRFEENEFPNSLLLGDSAYPLTSYLLTPINNPVTRGERLFNEAHIRTRNAVERLFGVWKRRFPTLAYGMRLKLTTILAVIVATGVLHNIAVLNNEQEPPPAEGIDPHELEQLIADGQIPDVPYFNRNVPLINNTRNNFVNNYFSHLPEQ